MRRYGQFCPVAKAAEVFCQRWTALILRNLSWGATRFSEIQRGVPMMSPSLLTQRLRELEREGIVTRVRDGRVWRYYLTEAGVEFTPIIEAMGVWGQRWSRRELDENEVDLDLLLWGLERSARWDAFGKRAVVRVEFTDQADGKRLWWYLNDEGRCQLCVDDPGGGTDLYLAATLPDLIRVYRGDIGLAQAIDDGRLEALGEAPALRELAVWLNLSPLSQVRPARSEPQRRAIRVS